MWGSHLFVTCSDIGIHGLLAGHCGLRPESIQQGDASGILSGALVMSTICELAINRITHIIQVDLHAHGAVLSFRVMHVETIQFSVPCREKKTDKNYLYCVIFF